MDTKTHKSVLDLKKSVNLANRNISQLYRITSAIYQEINEVKRFVNFKPEEKPVAPLQTHHQDQFAMQGSDTFDGYEQYSNNNFHNQMPNRPMMGNQGRRKKVIDN